MQARWLGQAAGAEQAEPGMAVRAPVRRVTVPRGSSWGGPCSRAVRAQVGRCLCRSRLALALGALACGPAISQGLLYFSSRCCGRTVLSSCAGATFHALPSPGERYKVYDTQSLFRRPDFFLPDPAF